MTMSSKNTYSRHISQAMEKEIIGIILWLAEQKTKWWYVKHRILLKAAHTLYILGYKKALIYFNGKMVTKWFSDFPESYYEGSLLCPLNVEEFPENRLKMVQNITNTVREFYVMHNIKHTCDWNEFELYTFENENMSLDGFIYCGKYIFINRNAMKSKRNRQNVFLHEYCHYVSKGAFGYLKKINEGITEYVASQIAKKSNMKYLVHERYQKYFTVAKRLIEKDKDIMIAYLSADEELINQHSARLAIIELGLELHELYEVLGEYVDKKSHEL